MNKKEILNEFAEDFAKSRGALQEVISHNRTIDTELVKDLQEGNFKSLEEHIEISKIIMSGVKEMTELFKNIPKILQDIEMIQEGEEKQKINLNDLMSDKTE